jgi:hypothetical protein
MYSKVVGYPRVLTRHAIFYNLSEGNHKTASSIYQQLDSGLHTAQCCGSASGDGIFKLLRNLGIDSASLCTQLFGGPVGQTYSYLVPSPHRLF